MDHLTLERHQVWIYLGTIIFGLGLGVMVPNAAPVLDTLLWPVLALLLFATFVQVPLWHLATAFRDHRFIAAVLVGNFVLVPILVALMIRWLPDDPALRLGVLMVLLVPCTDWFITFTRLGGGDTLRAITVTPINLLVQLLLLPLYLWLFLGAELSQGLNSTDLLPAFVVLILLPLALAAITQRWIEGCPERAVLQERLAWWPVPLLALVVGMVAAAHVSVVLASLPVLAHAFWLYVGFLLGAALLDVQTARCSRPNARLQPWNAQLLCGSPFGGCSAGWMGSCRGRYRLSIPGRAFRHGFLPVVDSKPVVCPLTENSRSK